MMIKIIRSTTNWLFWIISLPAGGLGSYDSNQNVPLPIVVVVFVVEMVATTLLVVGLLSWLGLI